MSSHCAEKLISWRYDYDAFGRRIRKADEETGKSTLFF
ncbi:hypothetical protein L7C23_003420 [Salmonella enterica]|nr:hypothetical protein [Salmonella enterica subsp. enterica serovar Stuttgart]ECG2579300.1 hypothetical protein [Salmonella enterica subsp. enterica]EIV0973320.1 hypothetical protein [Salmonella enterica]